MSNNYKHLSVGFPILITNSHYTSNRIISSVNLLFIQYRFMVLDTRINVLRNCKNGSSNLLLTLEHILASAVTTVSGTLSSVNDGWFQAHQNVISFSSLLVYFADGGQMAALHHTVGGLKKQPNIVSWRRSDAAWLHSGRLHNSDLCSGIMTWHHYCALPWLFFWLLGGWRSPV